ncbi:hypothetical protein [Roseomonas indoligenes]|uniref:Uncharacterized protein n=1 Tax=Roseomonas indoligenes TaxID=2820811 RepID=A0A940S953_9PROT|nr:hypothetical protein [Pararoseomonas indoligenes]MBP0494787.1 hypothetical protein [Pararoseomonas indoligenes]
MPARHLGPGSQPGQRGGLGRVYFEFGRSLQAGLDCAGDLTPEQGAIFGWMRHRVDETPELRVEGSPGEPLTILLRDLHPRLDVEQIEGTAVTGFSLIHEIPRHLRGRILILGTSGGPAGGQEVALDLLAYDLPADVQAMSMNRDWGASYQLLRASALDAGRIRTLYTEEGPAGIFAGWLDRLPRLAGTADLFLEFRDVRAAILPDGELVVSGGLNLADAPPRRMEAMGCAVVRAPGGASAVVPLVAESYAPLEGGFVLGGIVAAPPDSTIEVVVQLRRGDRAWWFLAEVSPAPLPDFLSALSLPRTELSAPDAAALQAWLRDALSERSRALQGYLSGMSLSGSPAEPGGTALLFGVNDEYAARVLALLAPDLETRFSRIVLSGAAAGRAAAALLRRGAMEVVVEGDAEGALAVAARGSGTVAPIDTAALVDAAIEGNPGRLTANALRAESLPWIAGLHAVAGTGTMEATMGRVVAMMAGVDASALPMPAQRPDPLGGLLSEHLRGLWEMVPVTGSPR